MMIIVIRIILLMIIPVTSMYSVILLMQWYPVLLDHFCSLSFLDCSTPLIYVYIQSWQALTRTALSTVLLFVIWFAKNNKRRRRMGKILWMIVGEFDYGIPSSSSSSLSSQRISISEKGWCNGCRESWSLWHLDTLTSGTSLSSSFYSFATPCCFFF